MNIIWASYSFIVGACFGSFLNVCISRWPDGLSVVRPRSRCPKCERPIGAMENIPVVSWIALRGRCRGCRNPISFQYPLVEVITGVLWLGSYLIYGLSFTAVRVAVFLTVLLGIAITDAKRYLIPDGFTVFGIIWVIGTALVSAFTGDVWPFASAYDAIVGACAGAGAIAIAGWLGEVALKKEAMGFGDVTLMAMVGAAVGPNRALVTIFFGALIGAVVFLAVVYPIAWMRSRAKQSDFAPPLVPFGVFLAPAAVIALLWGDRLISVYTSYSGL
ncbi:MAG TPA: prepilin peptidase [Gemmatimonadaceae bacterium]|nr:prepilin peptidase [Gemmatimonadaceae bacterium]